MSNEKTETVAEVLAGILNQYMLQDCRLVDILSFGGPTIARGKKEIDLIVDALLSDDRIERALASRCGWQPIETSPKGGVQFLQYSPRRGVRVNYWSASPIGERWCLNHTVFTDMPTHWMPLPSPPESESCLEK